MSTLKVDTLQNSVGENLVFGNKNLLINGSQSVWQRSTSTSVSTDTYSTVDRWKTRVNSMGAFTISRSTDVPSGQGFGYSTKWDCTTADASPAASDNIVFEQRIEGQNLQHILKGDSSNAKKLTLSFWIKTNKTGTYICELIDIDNSRNISKSFTISSSSTWEKITLTYDGDTTGTLDNDNAFSFGVMIWFGAGSDFTTGTLQTSWGTVGTNRAVGVVNLADSTSNELYITGIQLEVGSKATDFEFESYERTLSRCQRYYLQSWELSTGILNLKGASIYNGTVDGAGAIYVWVPFSSALRSSPTVVTYSSSTGTSGKWIGNRSGSGSSDRTTSSPNTSPKSFWMNVSVGGAHVACQVYGHWSADAEL